VSRDATTICKYIYSTGFDVKKTTFILLKSSVQLKPAKDQPNRLIWQGYKPEPGVLPARLDRGGKEDSHHQPGTQAFRGTHQDFFPA